MPETGSNTQPTTTPAKPATTENSEQVKDHATVHLAPEKVANGAAETLHGERAQQEKYVQPAANQLPGGSTLIAASTEAEAAKEGERRDASK